MTALSRNFLRRRDSRQRVSVEAIIECRDVAQKVKVVDFSASGLRLDGIKGLAPGDPVQISLTPELKIDGQIAWSVWHKAGVKLLAPLAEDHPAFCFLDEYAKAIERERMLALVALARERVGD